MNLDILFETRNLAAKHGMSLRELVDGANKFFALSDYAAYTSKEVPPSDSSDSSDSNEPRKSAPASRKKPNGASRGQVTTHWALTEDPTKIYKGRAIPAWLKYAMLQNGLDPKNADDRSKFRDAHMTPTAAT